MIKPKENVQKNEEQELRFPYNGLYIVIPAHNESKNIAAVIRKCRQYTLNIVVVDDGSEDNTEFIAKSEGATVLRHIVNLGKGGAAKTGCDYAAKSDAKIILLIDADGQHDPSLIPLFLKKLKDNGIVIGVREFNKRMPFVFRFGNSFINFIIELLFRVKLKDSQSGYRAFWTRHYKKIRWDARDYFMESEMIANIGKHRLRYAQITIPTIYADNYKGTTVLDGIRIVYELFKLKVAKW